MKQLQLSEIFSEERVFLDLEVSDRFEAIEKVTALLKNRKEVLNADTMRKAAIEREEELSTGLQHGIAMPHARTSAVNSLLCAFARLSQAVDFQAPDGVKSDLLFFSAIPQDGLDTYLHLTAALVRKLNNPKVRESLRAASSKSEVVEILVG